MTIIRTTVDDKIYDSAADILSTLGMDVNAAVRMFLQGVVLHNGIPFELGSATNVLSETLVGINEIPLSVQYYQTEEKITPGEVNAVAQFTVSYR